jgi:hypothetical protein
MPTNTTAMNYDYNKHLYILNFVYVNSEFGLDFVEKEGSEVKAKDRMYQISRTIYNYIYAHTHYIKPMQRWLALDEDLRPVIQSLLEEQARYEYEMSAEFLSYQSGINVLNGIVIPLDKFRGVARIAPEAENIMRQNRLLYQGQRFLLEKEFNYEEEEY